MSTFYLKKTFTSKISKSTLRARREIDKFYSIPDVKINKVKNLYNIQDNRTSGSDILQEYQTQEKLDQLDLAKKALNLEKQKLEDKISKNLSNLTNEKAMRITQEIIEKARMDITPNLDKFNDDNLQKPKDEFGNYEKYFTDAYNNINNFNNNTNISKQSTPTNLDKGDNLSEDHWRKKFEDLKFKYANKSSKTLQALKDKRIAELIDKDLSRDDLEFTFQDYLKYSYEEVREKEDTSKRMLSLKKVLYYMRRRKVTKMKYMAKPQEVEASTKVTGILENSLQHNRINYFLYDMKDKLFDERKIRTFSFEVQDDIYSQYQQGYTVKELCYKYGALPNRIKQNICDRFIFWTEVFPIIGPSKYKENQLAMIKSGKYEFIDYGIDLDEIINKEKTLKCIYLARKKLNFNMSKEEKINLKETLQQKMFRQRSNDWVPQRYIGDYTRGYLLTHIIQHRSKGSKRVNKKFEEYCRFKDTKPGYLNTMILKKSALGPRLSTIDYLNV